jgi:hypothetical protein
MARKATKKECRTCKQLLPFASFHSNGGTKADGTPKLKADCKACYSAARSSTMLPLDARRIAQELHALRSLEAAVIKILVAHGLIPEPDIKKRKS